MKKKLHELIEMAQRGEPFEAENQSALGFEKRFFNEKDICNFHFNSKAIVSDWEVRMKREPRVIWHTVYNHSGELSNCRYESKEAASKQGKPIKFVEVLEGEE